MRKIQRYDPVKNRIYFLTRKSVLLLDNFLLLYNIAYAVLKLTTGTTMSSFETQFHDRACH